MELLPFEDFESSTKRLFRKLLLHFLSDHLETSHVVPSLLAAVHDTNSRYEWSVGKGSHKPLSHPHYINIQETKVNIIIQRHEYIEY